MQINKMGDYLLEQTNFDRQTNELSIKHSAIALTGVFMIFLLYDILFFSLIVVIIFSKIEKIYFPLDKQGSYHTSTFL